MWQRRLIYYLGISSCFVPPLLTALLIYRYGVDLIDWDQWEIAGLFVKASHGSLSMADLFAQQAEYRQFFPNLIFIALGWITHWNIKAEMFVSLLLACLIAFNLNSLSRTTFPADHSVRVLLTIISTLLIFSPAQFESWLLGEQIIYFMPAACITTGLCVGYSKLGAHAKLIICILLSIVSSFSSANGLICWFVVAPVLFSKTHAGWKNWRFAVWLLCFLLSAAVYFHGIKKPSYTPSLSTVLHEPLRGLFFFCAFLGAPLITSNRLILIAAGLGALLAVLFVSSLLYVWKVKGDPEFRYRLMGWLMLGTYSLLTAIMVTIGRVGFGTTQALSSRYITFSLYLIVSLVYLTPIILEHASKRGALTRFRSRTVVLTFGILMLLLLHGVNSAAAIRQMAWMRIRRLESKACLLFINVLPNQCLSEGFPELSSLKSKANAVNDLGFLRPPLITSRKITDIAGTTSADNGSRGHFEALEGTNNTFVASGWAGLPSGKRAADAVLLTYQKDQTDPIIFAYAQMRVVQPSIAGLFAPRPAAEWRWQTSIDTAGIIPPVSVSAWAFDATTGKAQRLAGTYVIAGNGEAPRLMYADIP